MRACFPSDVPDYSMVPYDEITFNVYLLIVWAVACLIGGVFLILLGATAAGSAVLGSFAGGLAGAVLIGSKHASHSYAAAVGATVGLVVVGLCASAWRPSATRSTLWGLAAIAVVATAILSVGVRAEASRTCALAEHFGLDWRRCPPDRAVSASVLLAIDGMFLAGLFVWQARRAPVRTSATTDGDVSGQWPEDPVHVVP
jgi:hypothetical protein